MRIMIDTNIIISTLLTPEGAVSNLLKKIIQAHTICLCAFTIEELQMVFKRKFPSQLPILDTFLGELSFELLYTPAVWPRNMPKLRDKHDNPILASAIVGDVDYLLTGDKDFINASIERPQIVTPQTWPETLAG